MLRLRCSPRGVLLRRRRNRGYTLAELAIAAALTGLLLAATVAWITSLLTVTTTQATVTVPRTSVQFVSDQLHSDLANAVSCSDEGLAPTVLYIDADALHLYISTSGGDAVARVSWLYDPDRSQLSRTQVPDPYAGATGGDPADWRRGGDGSLPDAVTCDTSELPTRDAMAGVPWVPIASYVTPATGSDGAPQPLFSGVGGPDSSYTGDCISGSDDDACLFTHIRAQLRTGSAAGASAGLDRAFDLNSSSSRL